MVMDNMNLPRSDGKFCPSLSIKQAKHEIEKSYRSKHLNYGIYRTFLKKIWAISEKMAKKRDIGAKK